MRMSSSPTKIKTAAVILLYQTFSPNAFAEDDAARFAAEAKIQHETLLNLNCNKGELSPKYPKNIAGFRRLGLRSSDKIGPADYDESPPGQYTRGEFVFEGMSVSYIFHKADSKKHFLESALFLKEKWNSLIPIKIGAEVNSSLRNLGIKDFSATSDVIQICNVVEGAGDCARLWTKKGRISAVMYSCYTG